MEGLFFFFFPIFLFFFNLQTTGISFFLQGSLHELCRDNDLDSSRNDNRSAKSDKVSYDTLSLFALELNETNIFILVVVTHMRIAEMIIDLRSSYVLFS